MGYYIKGFDQQPLNLVMARTNHPEISSPTPRQAILDSINYCQHTLNSWAPDPSPYAQSIVQKMNSALQQLNQLLTQYP